MRRLYGYDHEQLAQRLIANSADIRQAVVNMGVNPDTLLSMFNPDTIVGNLVLGAIGIDNLDGVNSFGVSMRLPNMPSCDPIKAAQGFTLHNGQLVFRQESMPVLQQILACRAHVYGMYIFREKFMSAWAMQTRALELIHSNRRPLRESFFRKSDYEMRRYLEARDDLRVNQLLAQLKRGLLYSRVYCQILASEPVDLIAYDCQQNPIGGLWAKQIANQFGCHESLICVSIRHDTGPRTLQVPVLTADGQLLPPADPLLGNWLVMVFISPTLLGKKADAIRAFATQRFADIQQSVAV